MHEIIITTDKKEIATVSGKTRSFAMTL